jgi:Flp pilus assembly pilin Flp
MTSIKQFVEKFLSEEDGASAVEYAILVGVVVATVLVAITAFGGRIQEKIEEVSLTPPTPPAQ